MRRTRLLGGGAGATSSGTSKLVLVFGGFAVVAEGEEIKQVT
jgi:hypothetical protein